MATFSTPKFPVGLKSKRKSLLSCGFTLIEILVVIAMIAILSAVSMAGFRAAFISANRARCATNLRAIGVGMLAYAADNNQNLPESGGTIAHGSTDVAPPVGSGLPGWTEQLEPYLGPSTDTIANRVYTCPDSSKIWPNNKQYSYFNGAHAGYIKNPPAGATSFGPVNLLHVHSLSAWIMAGDNSFGGFPGSPDDDDKDDYTSDPAFNGGIPSAPTIIPIHGGYSNILFGDGHVEALKYFDSAVNTTVYTGPNSSYIYLQ